MERQLAPRKTSRLLGYRLHCALHTGSLREVVDALPTTAPPPFPRESTQAPLSAFDPSIWDGTNLLGAAATALFQPAAFRLAVFAILLERGANPWAAGDNQRATEWVLFRLKDEPEVREWCVRELDRAKEAQHKMERYKAPSEVHDWIEDELASLDAEVEYEYEQVDDNDTPMQDYEPVNLGRRESINAPPAKRARSHSPLPDYEDVAPLAARSIEYPPIDKHHEPAERARDRDEPTSEPPRTWTADAGPRPSSSASVGSRPPPPHEPSPTPPTSAGAVDAAHTSTSFGSSGSSTPREPYEPHLDALSSTSRLPYAQHEPARPPRAAPTPVGADQHEPDRVKRRRSPSPPLDSLDLVRAAGIDSRRTSTVAPGAGPSRVDRGDELSQAASRAAPPPAQRPPPPPQALRLTADESFVFEPLIETLRRMHTRSGWVAGATLGQRMLVDFPDVYRRDRRLTSWKRYAQRAHDLYIVTYEELRNGQSEVRLTAEYDNPRRRQPSPPRSTASPRRPSSTFPSPERPERTTTALPPPAAPAPFKPTFMPPTHPLLLAESAPYVSKSGAGSTSSSSTDKIGQSWRDFTASRQRPRSSASTIVSGGPVVPLGAPDAASTSTSVAVAPIFGGSSAPDAASLAQSMSSAAVTVDKREEPAVEPPCPAGAPVPAPVPALARPSEASRLTDHEAHVFKPLIKTLRDMGARDRWVIGFQVDQRMRREFFDVYQRDSALSFWTPYSQRAQALRIITLDERKKPSQVCLTAEFATARTHEPPPPRQPTTISPIEQLDLSTAGLPSRPDPLPLDPTLSFPAPPAPLKASSQPVSTPALSTSARQSGAGSTSSSTISLGAAAGVLPTSSDSSAQPSQVNVLDVLGRHPEDIHDAARRPTVDEPLGPRAAQVSLAPVPPEMARSSSSSSSAPRLLDDPSAPSPGSSLPVTRSASGPTTARVVPAIGLPARKISIVAAPSASSSTSVARPAGSSASTSKIEPSAPSTTASGWIPSAAQPLGSSGLGAVVASPTTVSAAPGLPARAVSRLPPLARPPPPSVARPRPPSSTPRSLASSASPAPDPPPVPPPPPSQQAAPVRHGWAPTFPSALAQPAPAVSIPPASSYALQPSNPFAPIAHLSTSTPSLMPAVPAIVANPARAPAQQRVAGFVTMEVHRLPSYATDLVLKTYLLRGPSVFSTLPSATHLDQLEALVRAGEFRAAPAQQLRQHDQPPPVPKRQQVFVEDKDSSERRWAAVTYKTRADAERARAMFNGKKLVEGPAGSGEQALVWMEQGSEIARFRTQCLR
ncbi:hypothetical protein JCM8208_002792 [Rhodotorula glutinis]